MLSGDETMALTLLSIEEAAERYHLPLEQLRAMVDDGRIVPVAVNGHVLLDDDEVRKVAGNNGNHTRWIPLAEAAAHYSLSPDLLELLAKDGIIRSGLLGDEPHLAADDVETVAKHLSKLRFRNLEGVPIGVSSAARKYDFPFSSVYDWARRGHIRILRANRKPVLVNEADVAYARVLANIRGMKAGKALFPSTAH